MDHNLHVFFFPFMGHGHMIPILDTAKLFSARGVKSTIITTPVNAPVFTNTIHKAPKQLPGTEIDVLVIKFPAVEFGLPDGCENGDQVPSQDLVPNFFMATTMLKDQIEQLLREHQPDCLVADTFFPWATDIAAKFRIPRLVFQASSVFSVCASESLRLCSPQKDVSSDDEPFILPTLPHEIKLTRMHLAPHERHVTGTEPETGISTLLRLMKDSEVTSYGVLVNSFYELEPEYAEHYREVLRRRAWLIGPVSLCNHGIKDKARRGKQAAIDEHQCLDWLNSKEPNSVIYICFGSLSKFSDPQLREIAMGLESSEQNFIWVVRERGTDTCLPEGFEDRVRDRGLIIQGWAPQVLILDHESVGGFMTHCGWNSILESIAGGVAMVTWPFFGDQFYNEKLVTEVLKVGIGVGAVQRMDRAEGVGIGREVIANAVKRVMVGEEAEEMRSRARALKDMANKTMGEGGSSHSDLNALINELSSYSCESVK